MTKKDDEINNSNSFQLIRTRKKERCDNMNVIFLDFDGVLDTIHFNSYEDVEKRIIILADICHEYNCKVVIEAAAKNAIDEETMEVRGKWVNFIFSLFEKYKIK